MKTRPLPLFRIEWLCPECKRSGVTPDVRQGGSWLDIERLLVRLHRERSPGCPAYTGSFELEFRRVQRAEAPPIAGGFEKRRI